MKQIKPAWLLVILAALFLSFLGGLAVGRRISAGELRISVVTEAEPALAAAPSESQSATETQLPSQTEPTAPPAESTESESTVSETDETQATPTDAPVSGVSEAAPNTEPETEPPTTQPPLVAPTAEHPLNLNSATFEELILLPSIGEVLAQRILDYRTAHGAFGDITELTQVNGIGEKRFAAIVDLITVEAVS